MTPNLRTPMNSAIILAGGFGKRFGGETPKQFAKLKDKMVIEHSILAFHDNNRCLI